MKNLNSFLLRSSANAEAFANLTELANDLLGSGDFDIYQKTKEVIEDLVASRTQRNEDNELNALGAAIDNEAGIEPSRMHFFFRTEALRF